MVYNNAPTTLQDSCLKQLDDFRHSLLDAGQEALLEMPEMNVVCSTFVSDCTMRRAQWLACRKLTWQTLVVVF